MNKAFEKLKGVNIFDLKSYMEPTDFGSFNGVWVMVNEIMVNFFFFLLNAVVGFFSLLIRLLENIDLYSLYKNYVFNGAKSIWEGLSGSSNGGLNHNSLVGTLLVISAIYLFFQYFFSRGDISRKILHLLLVMLLGFSYFGTIAKTSGGLYLLDTVNNFSKEVSSKITSISVEYEKGKSVKIGDSLADTYIAETSYKAYLFINTGQENGKYKSSKDGKEKAFDDSKVLGSTKGGKFQTVKSKDRQDYLDSLGDGANDDSEDNRWVSAIPDFIFLRMFYVIFKIIEAFVLAVPIILVQILNVIAQVIVLVMILLFPFILLMSFVPRMQDLIFGALKIMFGGLAFPAITSLITLIIFYIEKMVEGLITSGFDGVLKTMPSLILFGILFKLLVTVVAKAMVYILLWKYKGQVIQAVLGSRARMVTDDIGRKVETGVARSRDIATQVPGRSLASEQHLGNFALGTAGFATGAVVNTANRVRNKFASNTPEMVADKEPITEENTVPKPMEPDNLEIETPIEPPIPEQPTLNSDEIPSPIQEFDKSIVTPELEQPIPIQESPESPQSEFEQLKEQRLSAIDKLKIQSLEKRLEVYKDPEAMFRAQGSSAFTRNFRKTLSKDEKLQANIDRRDRLTQRLNELRGGA